MKRAFVTLLLLAGTGLSAAPARHAGLPPSPWADTEISTNVAFAAAEARMKRFVYALSLEATPSNNVQVAFGSDADGDGVLGPDEEDVVAGWDCGAWFVRDVRTGTRLAAAEAADGTRRELRCTLGMHRDGRVWTFSAKAGAEELFPGLSAEPPAWLHDGAWNMLRLTARGAGNPASRFLVQTVSEGFSFIFR